MKRGNLHPEQHQIGKRSVATHYRPARPRLAGRWLEPRGDPGPRGMAAGPARVRPVGATEPGLPAVSHCFSQSSARFVASALAKRNNRRRRGLRTGPGARRCAANAKRLTKRRHNRGNVGIRPSATRSVALRQAVPGFDFTPLQRAFDDRRLMFQGNYRYLACDTLYRPAQRSTVLARRADRRA